VDRGTVRRVRAAKKVFLVTGSSSGIGRAIVETAARSGHRVFATARNPAALSGIAREGVLEPLALDVTSSEQIHQAVESAVSRAGRIDVLVNNAGFGQMGAVEDIPLERWRAEFDVNFFGLIEMTRAVLPTMRRQGGGCVVNIGSIAGKIAYPFGGPYCASKFALEALSDALRLEVERFGIRVVLVDPGPITTRFGDRVREETAAITADPRSAYHDLYASAHERFRKESALSERPPEAVARIVLRAAASRRPRARYMVTPMARIFALAKRFCPDFVLDAVMRRKFR
jgi:NAD(P)-dependent dehydrogenase (short-subunit alcohol dehydrogenase family)